MTENISFEEIYHALGPNLDYYPDVVAHIVNKFGESYNADELDQYESRLTIHFTPRPLPKEAGSVISFKGKRWMRMWDTSWSGPDGDNIDSTDISGDWKRLL